MKVWGVRNFKFAFMFEKLNMLNILKIIYCLDSKRAIGNAQVCVNF